MLWEVEIRSLGRDAERERVCDEFDLLTHAQRAGDLITGSARGYLLEGDLGDADLARLTTTVLVDPLVETATASPVGAKAGHCYTVLLKPGVMDPVAQTVLETLKLLKLPVTAVRTFRRYFGPPEMSSLDRDVLFRKVLANDAIEQVVVGPVKADHLGIGSPYTFKLVTVPLTKLDDAGLVKLSKDGMLALSLDEMKAVQAHFRTLGREPTDCELETIAQTWSEHCSHKTLKGTITLTDHTTGQTRTYKNLLKETVFAATQTIRQKLGADDWCVSVFADNAGVVKFDDRNHLCFKVETHNHPSAIEPYGGANTGIGGVIRDLLGTGLAARPVCNTDVFCFAPPDFPADQLPQGVLHPRRVMQGVVAGVRDYGNRMGIPTVNGAILFDDRYLANPLVFCGTVGVLPADKAFKKVDAGDLIVAVGGRTGRDGIHGATFSSLELTHESETVSGGAVQIGNAITEKKVQDVILQARDRGLFTAITDCGAGGFSSAVGEMAADLGATVNLEAAPLKYEGLSYTEVWISESQERMVLSVPPAKWPELKRLCDAEDVEAAVLGEFDADRRLKLYYQGNKVADLDMHFLHEGRPTVVREAVWGGPREIAFSRLEQLNQDWEKHFNKEHLATHLQSLPDHLAEQLGKLDLPEAQRRLAKHVCSFIDRTGYLGTREKASEDSDRDTFRPVSLEEIAAAYDEPVGPEEVEDALVHVVQKLDPPGVGARTMAECLLLQVAPETPHADILRVLIRDHLDDIANNRIPVIHKATKFDIPAIHDAIEALRRLDPKPGLKFRQPPEPRQGVPPLWFPSPDFLKLSIADLQAKIAQELQENPFLELKSVAPQELLLKILAHYSVCSKEWVIRQYDHEVQSMSAVKPLVGVANDGPSDAAVIMPVLGSWAGAAVGCGINPRYGDHDPYWMAANAIDEAVRNVVAVGADPRRTAILDNFCWGNVNDPAVLGALVRTAEACRDVAVAFGAPFVSGKDSLNNTYAGKTGERLDIPHTLLVSALGRVPDIRQCVTMDLKEAGNRLYVVGNTRDELGGSHLHVVTGRVGGNVPRVDLELAPRIFAAVHTAITRGLVRACHDLSEGGLAVALAEMAFAGGLGVDFTGLGQLPGADGLSDEARLFSESPTRFILEVKPENAAAFEACFVGLPVGHVGVVLTEPRVRLAGSGGEWLVWVKLSELKDAWQKPLRW